jgi:thiol reductant ABC exporter CydD subunit
VKARLRARLAARLFDVGPLRVRGERTGELTTTVGEAVDAVDGYLGQALPQIALVGLAPALVLAVYLALDPLSALALLVVAPFVPVLTALIGLKTRDLMDRRWAELARMSAHFLDMLQGLPTLKLFGQSGAQAAGIERVSRRYGRSTMDVLRVAFQSSLVLDLAATMGVALVAVEVGTRLLLRSLPFERALLLLLLAPEFFLPLRQLGVARHARLAARSAAARIFALLDDAAPATAGRGAASPVPGVPAKSQISWGGLASLDVRLHGVRYTPPGRGRPALEDLTLSLPEGRVTALVGPSGAGKSTVAALLLRLAEPDRGAITVGGRPLRDLDPSEWRRQVAWVPQLPHLFHGTIADNIRLGRPDAALEEVLAAARAAAADGFVCRLPLGYATPVGEDGAALSGGQRQRIALARAFLLDRPVLVLDEPTVHLDRQAACAVRRAIEARSRGRTVLLLTHDQGLAAQAHRVVALDGGRAARGEASA